MLRIARCLVAVCFVGVVALDRHGFAQSQAEKTGTGVAAGQEGFAGLSTEAAIGLAALAAVGLAVGIAVASNSDSAVSAMIGTVVATASSDGGGMSTTTVTTTR
jgi:hypothetical protein